MDDEKMSAALPQQVYQNLTLPEAESHIEGNLITTARAYVATGYFLKRIRNDRLYEEDGYKNFDEYIRAKYGKGKDWASRAIKVLGGEYRDTVRFELPGTDIDRTLVVIEKVKETPKKYPRKAGTPSKEPIK